MLTHGQQAAAYQWPTTPLDTVPGWSQDHPEQALWRAMPEERSEVAADSRWPAFFPSPICLVTAGTGDEVALEKVVGASIVNRFPYLVALSFCRERLSERHYDRRSFCEILERSGRAAVQFIAPGPEQQAAMAAIEDLPDIVTAARVRHSGLPVRPSISAGTPVFRDSFLVYEAKLVESRTDSDGRTLFEQPWVDVGSHRIYFFRITTIQLREDIANGDCQVSWRSLPSFTPETGAGVSPPATPSSGYVKGYTPDYRFPAAGTIAFRRDYVRDGMSVLHPADGVIEDNDDARWPCFFPQSAGIITSRGPDGTENVMPCGSTTVVSRHPLVIAPCVSYAAVNERYAPRVSLEMILESGWFGCGVPYLDDSVVEAIKYAGNTSLRDDVRKLANSGLAHRAGERVPILTGLPIFYECEVVGHEYLGTHVMVLGRVNRIRVASEVTDRNPLQWCPWPDVVEVSGS